MYRLSRVLGFALAFVLISASAATALVDREKGVRGIYYEVSGTPGHPAKSKVFLLGSIHVADTSVYPLPDRIEAAFKQSPVLVVEADVTNVDQSASMKLLSAGMFPQGGDKTLKTSVSPECYAQVEAAAQEIGVPMERLNAMKPWLAAMTFEAIQAQMAGLNPKLGIDLHFLTPAHKETKTVVELEGVDEQLKLFNNLPPDQQNALLFYTVMERDKFKTELDRLFKAWRAGNAAELSSIVDEGEKEYPDVKPAMDALLTKRNKTMTEKIAAFLATPQDHFVVVGAAHLVGLGGIAAQLRARGFAITQP